MSSDEATKEQAAEMNGENTEESGDIKSALQRAQERAEALLSKSDEELEEEMGDGGNLDTMAGTAATAESKEQEYLEHLQRLQAEFTNYRNRVEREKVEFAKYAAAELITEMTDVLDDFERGLDEEHAKDVPEAFLDGIQGVYRKLKESLQKRGLERIETVGQPFDPELHEAVMQEPTDEYPPGVICREVRPGYVLEDRLLRAPMVQVATEPQE